MPGGSILYDDATRGHAVHVVIMKESCFVTQTYNHYKSKYNKVPKKHAGNVQNLAL